MKKSCKRILLIEMFAIISLLLVYIFEASILSVFFLSLFMFCLLFIFKVMTGFEQDNYRYTKDIMLDEIIDITIYYICYFLLGIIIGFAKNNNYYNMYSIINIIIPLLLFIVIKEFLRKTIIIKIDNSKSMYVITTVLFIIIDSIIPLTLVDFNSSYSVLCFLGLTFFPAISTNIYLNYISKKVGLKPTILYLILVNIIEYLLPIVPNPSKYLNSLIRLCLPVIMMIRRMSFFKKQNINTKIYRDYRKKSYVGLLAVFGITLIIVYYVSGYFRYYAIAIASGSMSPTFDRGSVVILDQKKRTFKEGEIIAFRVDKTVIVHRIIRVNKIGSEMYYYTKGDSNKNEDNFEITAQNIIGVVSYKIKYIGYPTVLLSEL